MLDALHRTLLEPPVILSLDVLDYAQLHSRFGRYPLRSFGLAMAYTRDSGYSGILAQGDNLFITAHGDGYTVGHPAGQPRFCAVSLADWLEQAVLPCNFAGDIYLAAPGATAQYLADLCIVLGDACAGNTFGLFDRAYGELLPAGHPDWQRAENKPAGVLCRAEDANGTSPAA